MFIYHYFIKKITLSGYNSKALKLIEESAIVLGLKIQKNINHSKVENSDNNILNHLMIKKSKEVYWVV